jgi:hypothetical protein
MKTSLRQQDAAPRGGCAKNRAVYQLAHLILTILILALPQAAPAQQGEHWVVSWVGSAQGPYPVGNPVAQPDQKFAFPSPTAGRMIKRSDLLCGQGCGADRRDCA